MLEEHFSQAMIKGNCEFKYGAFKSIAFLK
jgi:hypothetical protein